MFLRKRNNSLQELLKTFFSTIKQLKNNEEISCIYINIFCKKIGEKIWKSKQNLYVNVSSPDIYNISSFFYLSLDPILIKISMMKIITTTNSTY